MPDSTPADDAAARRRKLRAVLDGVQLNPEQTNDDVAPLPDATADEAQRDAELDANRPPHHGN